MFKVGDQVLWIDATSDVDKGSVGTIVDFVPSIYGVGSFHLYEVQFDFGLRSLYGTQLTRAFNDGEARKRKTA